MLFECVRFRRQVLIHKWIVVNYELLFSESEPKLRHVVLINSCIGLITVFHTARELSIINNIIDVELSF